MSLFMDLHRHIPDLTADAVAAAHQADLKAQAKYDVKGVTCWFSEDDVMLDLIRSICPEGR